jgi:histidinol dehydrogenase
VSVAPSPASPLRCLDWHALDAAARAAVLARPSARLPDREAVRRLLAEVRGGGDAALRTLTWRYDGVALGELAVGEDEIEAAAAAVPAALHAAIDEAWQRLRAFHAAGGIAAFAIETAPGVHCERLVRPIARVGLYVPAGSAPLPSTALMLGVPAQLAGCREIVLCTPPDRNGRADAAVLVAARRCGITRVYKLGGAQAIAAMAYGSESVPRCDKLFGPGSAWVTAAKLEAAADGIAIDLPAGPSEVMVIADAGAEPAFVAADLLAQAEHGADSQALLVTDAATLAVRVGAEITRQLGRLPRRDIAAQALRHGCILIVDGLARAFEIANAYAPEHLIVNVRQPRRWLPAIESAGSVFLGAHAPESVGDYCSGTNHVLPTAGGARAWSGVSVASFQKQITVQELTRAGLAAIGPCAIALAEAEGLRGHAEAVRVRQGRGA